MSDQASTVSSVSQRSVQAGLLLTTRSLLLRFVSVAGTIILSWIFLPGEFGFLAVAYGFLGMFGLFGNVGLGAAIVRNQEEPGREDFEATFFVQMVTVLLFILIIWLLADKLALWLLQDTSTAWPIRVAALAVLGGALQIPPRVALERHMAFGPIVAAEFAETFSFYTVAIGAGLMGASIWALALAIALRAFAGIPFVYFHTRQLVVPRWHTASVRKLIGFGAAFQASSVVNTLRESLIPITVAAIAGPVAAGYYGWARGIVEWELAIFSNLWKVGFPAFARLPNDAKVHSKAAEKVLALVAMPMFPLAALWIAFGQDMIRIAFGEQWLPAYMLSAVMISSMAVAGTISVATAGLVTVRAGAGHILTVQSLHSIAFFVVTIPLLPSYGLMAVGLGWLASNLVDAGLLLLFSAEARPSLRPLVPALLSALVGLGAGLGLDNLLGQSLAGLAAAMLCAGLAILGTLLLFGRNELALARETAGLALPILNR